MRCCSICYSRQAGRQAGRQELQRDSYSYSYSGRAGARYYYSGSGFCTAVNTAKTKRQKITTAVLKNAPPPSTREAFPEGAHARASFI